MVRCRDNSLYSGITNNLSERVAKHNAGSGAKYVLPRRPVTLIYSESYNTASEARRREVQIKSWSKTKKERLIEGFPRPCSE